MKFSRFPEIYIGKQQYAGAVMNFIAFQQTVNDF
jgi:hypothetical protein